MPWGCAVARHPGHLNIATGVGIGGSYYESVPLEFEVDIIGHGSRVKMNGQELPNVRDIKIHQPLDGGPIVTIEFLATRVKGWVDG